MLTRKANLIFQIVALAAQMANGVLPILSPDGKVIALAVIGFLQGVVAILAHGVNPDGTPASVAFIDPKK